MKSNNFNEIFKSVTILLLALIAFLLYQTLIGLDKVGFHLLQSDAYTRSQLKEIRADVDHVIDLMKYPNFPDSLRLSPEIKFLFSPQRFPVGNIESPIFGIDYEKKE